MATLHFTYSTMKQASPQVFCRPIMAIRERGMNTMIFTFFKRRSYGDSEIVFRIGLRAEAETFTESDNLFKVVKAIM
ncbi:MAG: hypothetical protein Ct9H300mP6_04830 [Gammaproteobacteria bacterium]|nr:MAG: hypothetical protein Ct9H300mP6_04830 [Gammaproteobacteria bacterium]